MKRLLPLTIVVHLLLGVQLVAECAASSIPNGNEQSASQLKLKQPTGDHSEQLLVLANGDDDIEEFEDDEDEEREDDEDEELEDDEGDESDELEDDDEEGEDEDESEDDDEEEETEGDDGSEEAPDVKEFLESPQKYVVDGTATTETVSAGQPKVVHVVTRVVRINEAKANQESSEVSDGNVAALDAMKAMFQDPASFGAFYYSLGLILLVAFSLCCLFRRRRRQERHHTTYGSMSSSSSSSRGCFAPQLYANVSPSTSGGCCGIPQQTYAVIIDGQMYVAAPVAPAARCTAPAADGTGACPGYPGYASAVCAGTCSGAANSNPAGYPGSGMCTCAPGNMEASAEVLLPNLMAQTPPMPMPQAPANAPQGDTTPAQPTFGGFYGSSNTTAAPRGPSQAFLQPQVAWVNPASAPAGIQYAWPGASVAAYDARAKAE